MGAPTRVKIILRKYLDTFMWEPLADFEATINKFVETHDVVEIAPIGMDGVMVRYVGAPTVKIDPLDWARVTGEFTEPCSVCGKKIKYGESFPTTDSYIHDKCRPHMYTGREETGQHIDYSLYNPCIKCHKDFDNDHLPIPASGSHNSFVHMPCWHGCVNGGPHKWEIMKSEHWPHSETNYKKCTVCFKTDYK